MPGVVGVKLTGPYVPSPLTARVVVNATVLQSFGPKAVKVMVPPAGPPAVVGLITGVPGSFAVPVSVAVSLMGLPSRTGPAPALVASVGFTGFTVKHSPDDPSEPGATPFACDAALGVKSPRQQ